MHPTGTVRLGCTDCHGGNPKVRSPVSPTVLAESPADPRITQAKRDAHVPSRLAWAGAANPIRAYTAWLQESPEYIQFVNPGDLRVADRTCGPVPCRRGAARPDEHDDARRDAVGRRALQQRIGAVEDAALRRELRTRRIAAASADVAASHRRGDAHQGRPGVPRSAPALGGLGAGQRAARVRAGRPQEGRSRQPQSRGEDGPAGRHAERPRVRHEPAYRSGVPRPPEDAPAGSAALVSRDERSARRLPRQRVHGVPRGLRQRPIARARRPVRAVRQPRSDGHRGSHHLQVGEWSSDSPPVHAVDSLEPVHDLPHASRHEHGHDLLRLHMVGQRDRRRVHVSQ